MLLSSLLAPKFFGVLTRIFKNSTLACMSTFDSLNILRQTEFGVLTVIFSLLKAMSLLFISVNFRLTFKPGPLEFSSLSCLVPLGHFYQNYPIIK